MPHQIERIDLVSPGAGTARHLLKHRYGTAGQGPKAYLQASLHADETPAMLTAHHLVRLLNEADARGDITGEIVLVPYANPIGLSQWINGYHAGRYEMNGGGNFNRGWPDLLALVGNELDGKLGDDLESNIAKVRQAFRHGISKIEAGSAMAEQRLLLLKDAVDADIVLDLHCDDDALMHLFIIPQSWPDAKDLAAELGCHAVLMAEDSGGGSFDEVFSNPWTRLMRRYPEAKLSVACLSATVELRGVPDVHDALASEDAAALFRVLQRRGLIAGDPGPLPELKCEATDLRATESLRAPAAGILSYHVAPGSMVRKGDVIAELIDPAAENPLEGRQDIRAGTDGLVLSRKTVKWTTPNSNVVKIVGKEILPDREGVLLED